MNFGPKVLQPKLLKHFQGLSVDPVDSAKLAASHLFTEIKRELGDKVAHEIFAKFRPLTPRQRQQAENDIILLRLELTKNLKKLARQLAHEKFQKPNETQIESIERHIERLNEKRNGPKKPPALRHIVSLSYSKSRKLFRDNETGKLYSRDGTEVKSKPRASKNAG